MRYTTYCYNTLTCQYERVRTNARSVFWYLLGVVAMASCMLLGVLMLHDLLVNTENENSLRKENRALRRHHTLLSEQLNELQPVLTSLQNKDRVLHARVFGVQPPGFEVRADHASKEKLLLADGEIFRQQVTSIGNNSADLIGQSLRTNHYFGAKLIFDQAALARLNSLPTLQPVTPWQSQRLISGFGARINPFHKGLYDHLGVDIAMPRGTPVIAAGSGKIVQLKRSDLEAGYGNYIEIDHGDGLITRYAHLEDIQVRFGAKVDKGEVIGTIGSSGGSVAPHLHYEVLHHGKNIDPVTYMVGGLSSAEHHQLTEMSHQQNQSLD